MLLTDDSVPYPRLYLQSHHLQHPDYVGYYVSYKGAWPRVYWQAGRSRQMRTITSSYYSSENELALDWQAYPPSLLPLDIQEQLLSPTPEPRHATD